MPAPTAAATATAAATMPPRRRTRSSATAAAMPPCKRARAAAVDESAMAVLIAAAAAATPLRGETDATGAPAAVRIEESSDGGLNIIMDTDEFLCDADEEALLEEARAGAIKGEAAAGEAAAGEAAADEAAHAAIPLPEPVLVPARAEFSLIECMGMHRLSWREYHLSPSCLEARVKLDDCPLWRKYFDLDNKDMRHVAFLDFDTNTATVMQHAHDNSTWKEHNFMIADVLTYMRCYKNKNGN